MFTKFRNYTDRELYKEVSIHIDFRAGNEETHALQLLQEIRNRMAKWIDLHPVYQSQKTDTQ